jgi:hypothetical protein
MSAADDHSDAEPRVIAVAQPGSKLVFDYWNALRNGRVLPRRSEVDPAALRLLLPHVFILQRYDSEHIVFRVAGTALCAAFGRELRDHNFVTLWSHNSQPAIRDLLLQLAERAQVATVRAVGLTLDKRTVSAETVLLPLADDWDAHSRILGIASFGREEAALGWRKLVRLEIAALALIDPDRDRLTIDRQASPESPSFAFRLSLVSPRAGAGAPAAPTLADPWSEHLRSRLKLDD